MKVMTKETNPTVEIVNNVSASKPQPMEQKLTKNRKTGTKVYKDARGFLGERNKSRGFENNTSYLMLIILSN